MPFGMPPVPPVADAPHNPIDHPTEGLEVMAESPVPAPPTPRRQWPLVVVGLAIAASLFTLAFALGRNSAATDVPVAIDVPATTQVTNAPVQIPPATTPGPDYELVIPEDAEPVAAIAAAVGPTVVQIETSFGVGSGVIYDPTGLILTAAHVVEGVTDVSVRLADGRIIPGVVVGTHTDTDVAVVRVDVDGPLPAATLGIGSNPQVGSLAVALGSPFGLDRTVTAGIVSAVRSFNGDALIQTDAAINPGNSGGPLVDIEGRVIGINDSIRTQSGANDGVGFAIDIDLAAIVAEQLVAGEPVHLALLGVSTSASVDGRAGALVNEVVVGSAAEDAGLAVGDVILSIDGVRVQRPAELRAEVISTRPDTMVEVEIVRDGQTITLPVTLGSAPA
jgi:serine protease Do